MDDYKSLLDQEEILKYYIDCVLFEASLKAWVEALKFCNCTYDEIVLKTMEKYDMSKWWAEEKVQEFWNENEKGKIRNKE